MIDPKDFLKFLNKNKINFYCGVPDSCVASLVRVMKKNYILANEGTAISFAGGYYLSTKKLPLVFFQNSGLGNATDPLTNLLSSDVYRIPLILLIGWRGYPNTKDEPQHMIQGRSLIKTLNSFDIRFCELKSKKSYSKIGNLIKFAKKKSKTVAILVNNKTFINNYNSNKDYNNYKILRSDVLNELLKISSKKDRIFSSVGYNSRELYQLSLEKKISRKIIYLVGGMGHTAAIALGSNLFNKNTRNTICIDGDGSFIMHLGSLLNASNFSKKNFKYLVLNNDSHESIGSIDLNFKIDYEKFAKSIGFKKFICSKNKKEVKNNLKKFIKYKGSVFHTVYIKNSSFKNLMRVKEFEKIKKNFFKK